MTLVTEINDFKKLFKHHVVGFEKPTLIWGEVKSVDWSSKTMTAIGADDDPIFDILLGIGGMFIKPKIGAVCLVSMIEGDNAMAFLVAADQVELVEFNGGKNGGLAIVPELKKELNKLSQRVDGLINAINSPSVVATPQDGGTALLGLLRAEVAKIKDKESFEKIEDVTIKH